MTAGIINHFFRYEFVYIFIFLTISCLAFSFFIKNKLLKKIFLSGFSFFLVLAVVESVLCYQNKAYNVQGMPLKSVNNIIFKNNFDVSKFHKIRYIRYKIGEQAYNIWDDDYVYKDNETVSFDVQETIYENRFRYTKSDIENEADYVFLGCSFIYGLGLSDNETLPYIFSDKLKYKYGILNCGIPAGGSNSALNVLNSGVLDNFIKNNKKIKHFIYLAMSDHIKRNFRNESSSEPSDNYIFLNNQFVKAEQPFDFFNDIFFNSYIYKKLFLDLIENKNKEFYKRYFLKSVENMNKIIKEKYNSEFTVILWNDFRYKFDKDVAQFLKKANIDVIELEEFGKEYVISDDGHPNYAANKKIADILIRHLKYGN